MSPKLEVVAPFQHPRGAAPTVDAVRGTLLAGSIQSARALGQWDRYLELLEPAYHAAIRELMVASWVPVDVAFAHYNAMDRLDLPTSQQIDNGRKVAEKVQNTYVGTILRGLKSSGTVSPMGILERFQLAWARVIRGGDSAVFRTGPKDVRVECVSMPLANIAYFRNGWQGMFESSLGLVTRRVFVRQDARFQREDQVAFLVSWV